MTTDAADDRTATSKSQLAYEWLRDRIVTHRFTPGYRLVLSQLATELGVSTVPVREAVRRLEAEGLVTYEKNVGAQVALVDEGEYVTTMQTLAVVEGAATGFSAPLLTAEDLAKARAINQRMRDSLEHFDPRRFTELNEEFHSVLFLRCPNEHMTDLVRRGWSRLRMLRDSTFSFVPGRAVQSVAEHDHLMHLIETGADPVDIELAARKHRTATLDAFLDSQHPPRES
ncbi:GntR family transcriptional regulator [Saccharopolyspora dendranthemae]|uniref:GntR family transcriptional regulator n=1 Tax=Saccharopolyspora dendranthemae TaxID=1181886 RepID=A0A561V8G2_9PSEU|nr:GntR family transcriptional regulator [Saccharopolyspora dendranthemae]TWG07901.1 GntR family transcriptional regulator [Saccharopolyspora dendranthemae]